MVSSRIELLHGSSMNHSHHLRRQALAGIALLATIGTAHAQLLVDGGFETPAITDPGVTWVGLPGTTLTGWSSFSTLHGAILFIEPVSPVSEGKQAVELEVPGDSISQTFATLSGGSYRLSFDLSAYKYYGGPGLGVTPCPCKSMVDVSVGSANERFWGSSEAYETQKLDFTADASFTTLTFTSPSVPEHYGNYPHLDNVSVVQVFDQVLFREVAPVPEPETYALMLAGLGAFGWARRRASAAKPAR